MSVFLCPVCREPLTENAAGLVCPAGHAFDRARSGYVNLLSALGGGNHGDDRLMVRARRAFLDGGYYAPLAQALSDAALRYAVPGVRVLDAGCGEGYYTSLVRQTLEEAGKAPQVFGVDISKDALSLAGRRDKALELAVASIYGLPLPDRCCDLLLSVFSPLCRDEFCRVLTPGGIWLLVYPLAEHLWELKAAVYDEPYPNRPDPDEQEGFALLEKRELRFPITLPDREPVENLFMMTPYYYKTSRRDQEKLSSLTSLTTQAAFAVCAYRLQPKTGT